MIENRIENRMKNRIEKRKQPACIISYILFLLTGSLFLFCCLTGSDLAEQGNIVWTGAYTAKTLALSLLGGVLLGDAVRLLHSWVQCRRRGQGKASGKSGAKSVCEQEETDTCVQEKQRAKSAREQWKRKPSIIFTGSALLTVLAWLPAYLAYYPAICSYDMPIQTGQIAEHYYIDHHPIAHTFLLKCFMELGDRMLGSVTAGIGVFALYQLLFLAVAFAYGVFLLYQNGVRRLWLILVQLWCMFYPFHWYMGVSITKDTIFTGFFVLQILSLYELMREPDADGHRVHREIAFLISTVGMILFRNNGKYAFLVLLVILFLAVLFGKKSRRFFGRSFLWALGAFLIGNLMLSAIFRLSGAEQGDKREMLSLPIQQLARTMLYHGGVGILPEDDNTMDEADKALINDFILNEGYKSYDPRISDPVKRNTNTYVVRYRAKDFLTTYLGLFVKYPGDYLNAALAVDAGYLYPEDESHAVINVEEDDRVGRGYVQTYWEEDTMNARGIYKESKWDWLLNQLEQWADENAYLKLPVLKYLFVPGVWLWFYLLLLAWFVRNERYRQCIPLALIGGYFVTLLLGPTVQLRYIYPVMSVFPFVLIQGNKYDRTEETDFEGQSSGTPKNSREGQSSGIPEKQS